MKYELEDAIEQLYYWQYPSENHARSFSHMLFDLIAKADNENLERLALGFPTHVVAWALWNGADDYGNQLFKDYGFLMDRTT